MLSTTDPGGVMARQLPPLAVVVPLLLGWLQLVGQRERIYDPPVGAWLLTTGIIACLLAVIASSARALLRRQSSSTPRGRLQRVAGEDELNGRPTGVDLSRTYAAIWRWPYATTFPARCA